MSTQAKLDLSHFTSWLAHGERGISSEAIVSHLTGGSVGRPWHGSDWPHDPSDFRRCQLLLNAYPLARLMFPAMRTRSPEWARLVDAWDEIHEAIEREAPDYLDPHSQGSAPLAYRLMRRIIEDGEPCGVCGGSGRGEECGPCKGTGRRSGGRCRAQGCYARGYRSCPPCCGQGFTRKAAA